MKKTLRRLTPRPILHLYNRIVSRAKIGRLYGAEFDLEWKRRAKDADLSLWRHTYDSSWENFAQGDLSPFDLEKLGELVPPGVSILDAGCGDGVLLESLAGKNRKLFGIDLSTTALKLATVRLKGGASFTGGMLESLPFQDKSFDVVFTTHTLEHVQNLKAAVSELQRICRNRLVIVVPIQEYLPYTEDYHISFFPTEEDLRRQILLPGATIERSSGLRGDVWLLWRDFGAQAKIPA